MLIIVAAAAASFALIRDGAGWLLVFGLVVAIDAGVCVLARRFTTDSFLAGFLGWLVGVLIFACTATLAAMMDRSAWGLVGGWPGVVALSLIGCVFYGSICWYFADLTLDLLAVRRKKSVDPTKV